MRMMKDKMSIISMKFSRKSTTRMKKNLNTNIWGKFNWEKTEKNKNSLKNWQKTTKRICLLRLITTTLLFTFGRPWGINITLPETSLPIWSGLKYSRPLKEEQQPITILASIFLKKFTSVSQQTHSWPIMKNWMFTKHFANMRDGNRGQEDMTLWMLWTTFWTH